MDKNKAIIASIVIVILTIVAGFYVLKSETTPKTQENQISISSERKPSKTLKEYIDDAGFSFKYPDDVKVSKIEVKDDITYSSLELTSREAKGKILIKVTDTKLKSTDEWFAKEGLKGSIREIEVGEISGKEINMNNKIIVAALDQNILFTIGVDTQDGRYWQSVYNTILSSFSFVSQKESTQSQESFDYSSDDAVLQEEIIE